MSKRQRRTDPMPVMLCPLCDQESGEDETSECADNICVCLDSRVQTVILDLLKDFDNRSPKDSLAAAFYSIALLLTPSEHTGRLVYLPPCLVERVESELNHNPQRRFMVRPENYMSLPIFYPSLDLEQLRASPLPESPTEPIPDISIELSTSSIPLTNKIDLS